MKISELMAGVTPNASYEGWVTADDWVLAIDTRPSAEAAKSTQKTGTARSFAVSGDRYIGDPAQDFMLSHAMKYAKGNAAVTNYVYFCMLNGKGEKGQVSVIVNSEGGGNAGESSSIDVNLQKIGAEPAEYTYSAE